MTAPKQFLIDGSVSRGFHTPGGKIIHPQPGAISATGSFISGFPEARRVFANIKAYVGGDLVQDVTPMSGPEVATVTTGPNDNAGRAVGTWQGRADLRPVRINIDVAWHRRLIARMWDWSREPGRAGHYHSDRNSSSIRSARNIFRSD